MSGGMESLGLGMILSWQDRMSNVVDRATGSLEKMASQAKKSSDEIDKSSARSAAAAQNYLKSAQTSLKIAAAGAAVLTGLGFAIKQSADSTKNMDDIVATLVGVGRSATNARDDVKLLNDEIMRLTGNINVSQEDLERATRVLASGFGAQGASQFSAMLRPLGKFTEAVGGAAEENAELLKVVFKTFGSQMPATLSMAEKAEKLLNMMGAASARFGMSQADLRAALEPTAGVAAASGRSFTELLTVIGMLHQQGKKGGAAGSAYEGFLRNVAMLQAQFGAETKKTAGSVADLIDMTDGLKTPNRLNWAEQLGLKLDDVSNLPSLADLLAIVEKKTGSGGMSGNLELKERGQLMASMRGTGAELLLMMLGQSAALREEAAALDKSNAMQEQAEIKTNNLASSTFKLREQLGKAVELIGSQLEPQTKTLVDTLANATQGIVNFANANPILTSVTVQSVAVLGSLAFAGGLVRAAIFGIRAAWLVMNATLLATPLGWIALGIAAAIGAIILIVKYWDQIVGGISAAWNWMKRFISAMPDWLLVITGPLQLIIKHWDQIAAVGAKAWEGIKSAAKAAMDWIMDTPGFKLMKWIFEKASAIADTVWGAAGKFAFGGDYSNARKAGDALGFDTWALKSLFGMNLTELGRPNQGYNLGPIAAPVQSPTFISDFSSPRFSIALQAAPGSSPSDLAKELRRELHSSWTFGPTGRF